MGRGLTWQLPPQLAVTALLCTPAQCDLAQALLKPHHRVAVDPGQLQLERRLNYGLHLSRAADDCTGNTSDLCICTDPTYFSTPLLWDKGPGVGKGQNTHLKEKEPAQAQLSGRLLQQLRIRPCP